MSCVRSAYLPVALKAWLETILVNDAAMSLNLNEDQDLHDEDFDDIFTNKSKLNRMKLGKYRLVDMLKQFWATCPSAYAYNLAKVPYISIVVQKLTDNPFTDSCNKGILMWSIRDYIHKQEESEITDDIRRKNWNSMPIDSKEYRLNNISYPLYPDGMNHALVIFKYASIQWFISLYFAVVLQQKIIIITKDVGRVTLILESVFKLVYPFDTSIYTTVSNVTEDMLEIVEAPFPVIIGCSPEVYKSIPSYKLSSMKSETVIINLDDNRIGWKNKVDFPKSQLSYLTTKLEDLKNSVNKIQDFNLDGYIDLTQDSLRSIKLQVMVNLEINMKIKKIFVNLMILIIGKFSSSHK